MKNLVLAAIIALTLSCGNDDSDTKSTTASGCTSPVVGSWSGVAPNKDKLVLSADGTFTYTGDDGCTSSGTFACPGTITQGTVIVTTTAASASKYCGQAGTASCAFAVNDKSLSYACGTAAARSYVK